MPIVGAAVLVAVLLGGDLANLLQGSMREIFATITERPRCPSRSRSVAFIAAFVIALVGGSVLMFLVKGGTVDVMLAANDAGRSDRARAADLDRCSEAAAFSIPRFIGGCGRLFRPYLTLGPGADGRLRRYRRRLSRLHRLRVPGGGRRRAVHRLDVPRRARPRSGSFVWITAVNLRLPAAADRDGGGTSTLGRRGRARWRASPAPSSAS